MSPFGPEPKNPQEALVIALLMAIEAPTSRESKIAIGLVTDIMDRFGLSARDLRRAQASADMLLKVRELQVEGKSVEDLMREGTLLSTPFRGPVGEANRNVDDVVIWLWTLAENPQEIARLLKATPKKTQKAANALHDEIRRRHHGQVGVPDDEVGRTSSGVEQRISLQGLIYLNLFSSQIAPDPKEQAFLFMRAAEVLSRAFEQNLTFTKEDLSRVIQQSMDSVRASMAMQDLVDSAPVGEANQRNTVTVIPAYGRDYKSKKDVLTDWKAGKDFIIHSYGNRYDGKYINKEDADRAGETVSIRYAGRTKQLIIRPG